MTADKVADLAFDELKLLELEDRKVGSQKE